MWNRDYADELLTGVWITKSYKGLVLVWKSAKRGGKLHTCEYGWLRKLDSVGTVRAQSALIGDQSLHVSYSNYFHTLFKEYRCE
jgi:hypothetical protein